MLPPKDSFSTWPWEQISCLLCELGIEFSLHFFSGSIWIPLCMAPLIVFSQPPSALPPGFQTAACWSCDSVLYRLRLEWIRQLAEKDMPNFISQSRSYPIILFKYDIFNHLFRSCCICFRWSNLRKSFLNLIIQIDFM